MSKIEKEEIQQEYNILIESKDTTTLTKNIIDYNKKVLSGRYWYHNYFTNIFNYSWWDDMPLIKIENGKIKSLE
jgi:hypothetical protein